jgi:hypothetical protein
MRAISWAAERLCASQILCFMIYNGEMIMNAEHGRIWMQAVVVYFKMWPNIFLEENSCKNSVRRADFWSRVEPWTSQIWSSNSNHYVAVLSSSFSAEDGDSMFHRNAGIYLRVYTASQPRISSSSSSSSPPWDIFLSRGPVRNLICCELVSCT